MRNLLGALVFTFAFSAAQHAAALSIDARLNFFRDASTSFNGGPQGGGIGVFEIIGGDDLSGTPAEFLLDEPVFSGLCLEPDEFVTTGTTYRFDIVDLAEGPTSRVGDSGVRNRSWLENFVERFDWYRVSDIDSIRINAAQAMAWETAFEVDNFASRTAGGVILDAGLQNAATDLGMLNLSGQDFDTYDSFALLNRGPVGGISAFTLEPQYQDFAVWNRVSAPMPLTLMGLGLTGLFWRRARREQETP